MKLAIFAFNYVILLSTVIDFHIKSADRRLSLALVRIFFIVPSLIATYLFTCFSTEDYIHPYFYHSENIFALLCVALGAGFHNVISSKKKNVFYFRIVFGVASVVVVLISGYDFVHVPTASLVNGNLVFSFGSIAYCSAMFLLLAILMLGWRLEAFWRSLDSGDRWRYKFLVVGLFLVCGIMTCSYSYRLAYLRMPRDHFSLWAILLVVAWAFMGYALAGQRLLNRKLFVSRKVVYASITPIAFSVFFIFAGLMSLMFRLFGWTVPFTIWWLFIVLGSLVIIILALSGETRRRIKYFISTHFYVNKYEYRDEWLAFSELLQGKLTEKGIVEALYQILRDGLYSQNILIWLGDIQKGFQVIGGGSDQGKIEHGFVPGDDAIVCYLHNAPYLYSQEGDDDPLRRAILKERGAFLQAHDIVLMVPLILGRQCVGMIGLGPETTGGRYGHDDFDLLAALSSHAASALLAIQNAEKLARTREQSAWSNLSAFVLHDIKNAATMLDLVRKNAPQHMDKPEFQQDMLASIDDALKRMSKVQNRLSALKVEMVVSEFAEVNLDELLSDCINKLSRKLPQLDIELVCPPDVLLWSDADFIYRILENLIINSWEAGGDGTTVRIKVALEPMIRIDIQDNGPGILVDLLPLALFEPFKTAKPKGSGIGLWQARKMADGLGGDIKAKNLPDGGACFTLQLPYRTELR